MRENLKLIPHVLVIVKQSVEGPDMILRDLAGISSVPEEMVFSNWWTWR